MQGLDWQTWKMAFVAGLNQKLSTRMLEPPGLTIAKDCQFDKLGDLQTRYPYTAIGADFLEVDLGTITNARRIVEHGDEKLLFTKDALYSWNARLSKWVGKGTHLAVKVAEKNVFATGEEQIQNDRAELNNTVFYVWSVTLVGGSTVSYIGAIDKTTGGVRLAPQALASLSRPRVVALSTKVLLTYTNGVNLYAHALDPDDPMTGLNAAATTLGACDLYYDITRVLGADQAVFACRLNPSTSYLVGTVTAGLVVATSTKARTAAGPVAVSSHPLGTHVQIVRTSSTNIQGDYLAISGLADVYTAQAIGTFANTVDGTQIAAAHRSTTDGGFYRCYVFWSDERSTDGVTNWTSKYNYVDTGNNLGSQANFVRRLDIGSRAFDHEGRVFVWTIFGMAGGAYSSAGALQNGQYLYRDDALLVARSAWNRGGGYLTTGHLPGVQSLGSGSYAYAGTERTIIGDAASPANSYSGRRPRDVTITFDSNEARRTARLGRTLYISGGEIRQYDSVRLTEVGFHVWPFYFALTQTGGGSVEEGTYGYKLSFASQNAYGERDESASIRVEEIEASAASRQINVADIVPLYITHKPTVACKVWRTRKNPNVDDPFYQASTSDPADITNPNRYIPNDTTLGALATMEDDLADASLENFGTHPQDNKLPSLSPPAATIIIANDTRLFLAGVAGEPNSVWYSKQRADGEVAAFHGALVAQVPPAGGDITALGFLNETLVVFRETAIYVLPGDGFDNTGGGTNYGPARAVSTDIGAVNHESVCVTDQGLVFKSSKGWYRLDRGFGLQYIGANVVDYDSETPLAVHLVESQHQLRVLSSSRMLVLDTVGGQWFEWTISDGVHACMWQGVHAYLTTTGAKTQQTSYATATYGIDVETAWIDLAAMSAFGRVRKFQVEGEYRSAHTVRVRLARDNWIDGVDTYFQDRTWTATPTVVGGPLDLEHGPSIQQVNKLKVRLTITPSSAGESVKLSALLFELGFKRGLFRRLPSAQSQ